MGRSRTLVVSFVTLLLLALPAGIAFADYGDGGGGTWDPCSFAVCRWVVAGGVTDADTGAPVAGATVTLQWRAAGGEWAAPPAEADLRPAANPQASDAAGRFTWLARGGTGEQVRVVVARDGYETTTGAARDLRADGTLDVALRPVPVAGPFVPTTPVTSAAPGPAPIDGAGGPAVPAATPPVAVKAGCAAKAAKARAACLRAAALAKALKACTAHKGAKRATCERRARALSACETKTGRKRAACRAKARAIGQPVKRHRR